ncbi:phage tail protein [Thalassospira sp. SM2505]
MAQHDYNVADGSGSAVRSDMNGAFEAIVTNNLGPSAPSPTWPLMWWGDTTAGKLKQRNAANTAWIDHGDLGAALLRVDGDGSQLTGVNGLPVGVTFWWPAATPPAWALELDGSAVSRATFSSLFAIMGTTFGAGDGSTTFNLPDLRGEFIRGWDNGRGVDGSRVFGSAQSDELKSHSHGYHTNVGAFAAGGAAQLNFNGAGSAVSTNAFGGSETRPRNIALLPCARF